jgi:REP element-mobilizing transposase RayT
VAQALACDFSTSKEPPRTPEGFQPVNPWKSDEFLFRRRNLPHLEVPGATYFVTFRCCSDVVLPAAARDLMMAAIKNCCQTSIDLDAAVVMPDHVHLVFRLLGSNRLSSVMQRLKGRSAREINQLLGTEGRLWMDESFDHVVRNEDELNESVEYIRNNPVKGSLVSKPGEYRWLWVREKGLVKD